MIITVSGLAGAGKGSVCRQLSSRLNYNYYSMGDLRRMMAKDRGMTIEEFNKLGETQAFTDTDADDYQVALSKREDNFIMEGRVSYHFIPNSIKIFLYVKPIVAAKRIFNDQTGNRLNEKIGHTLNDQLQLTLARDASDKLRYKKYYNIDDYTDKKYFDLYLDTSDKTVSEVTDNIVDFVKSYSSINVKS
jgi:cytidylate kinase